MNKITQNIQTALPFSAKHITSGRLVMYLSSPVGAKNSDPVEYFTIKNKENWKIDAQFEDHQIHFKVIDPWGLPCRQPIVIVLNSKVNPTPNTLVGIKNKIKVLSLSNNRFGFQVQKTSKGVLVIFGDYGLAGGGRFSDALILTALTTAVLFNVVAYNLPKKWHFGRFGAMSGGTAALISGIGLSLKGGGYEVLGNFFTGAGFQTMIGSYQSDSNEINDRELAQKALSSGVTSCAVSSFVKLANYFVLPGVLSLMAIKAGDNSKRSKLLQGAIKVIFIGSINIVGYSTQKYLKGKRATLNNVAIIGAASCSATLMRDAIASGLESAPGAIAGSIIFKLFKEGCIGGVFTSTYKLTSNFFKRKSLTTNVRKSGMLGFGHGVIAGIFDIFKDLKNLDQRRQNLTLQNELLQQRHETYASERDSALSQATGLLNGGFQDRAHWTNNNPQAIADRILDGQKVELRKGHQVYITIQRTSVENPAHAMQLYETERMTFNNDVRSVNAVRSLVKSILYALQSLQSHDVSPPNDQPPGNSSNESPEHTPSSDQPPGSSSVNQFLSQKEIENLRNLQLKERAEERKRVPRKNNNADINASEKIISSKRDRKETRSGKKLTRPQRREARFQARQEGIVR